MKVRVLEGILIIAFLISVGKAEDNDSERLEDPEVANPKGTDLQIEDLNRRMNTNNAKKDSDDLQTAKDTDVGKVDTSSTSQKLNNSQSYAMEQTGSDSASDTQTLSSNTLLTKYASNNANNIKVTEGRNYNPTLEQAVSFLEAQNGDEKSFNIKNIVKQSSYPDKTKIDNAGPEETLSGDAKQNGDENPFAQQSNAYPYNPDSSNLGSDFDDTVNIRSGYPYEDYTLYQVPSHNLVQASVSAGVNINNKLNHELNPYTFGYKPGFNANLGNKVNAANAMAQSSSSFGNAQNSAIINDDARSRVIWPHEYIFPHQTPGGETIIQCSRENELHYLWSSTLNCLVCLCLKENGILKPVCVSCSRCLAPSLPTQSSYIPDFLPPTPGPYVPLPIPDIPNPELSIPSVIQPIFNEPTNNWNFEVTSSTPPPEATCIPLPTGQPFTNPLNPCLLCICNRNINMFEKFDVRIECQENPDCVVPSDVATILPSSPDIPFQAPLPLCEKFPPHVVFPHPTDRCKECRCAQGVSAMNIPEQQITCLVISECVSQIIDMPSMIITPAPPIPISIKLYPGSEPDIVPESGYPVVIPTVTENPVESIPWPPVSTTPLPQLAPPLAVPMKGPLPGPPPHESCKPYPPNLPFQHPWDPCKICQCSEITVVGLINVEINCQTKPSCCTVGPGDVTSDAENQTPVKLYNGPSTFTPSSLTSYLGSPNAYIRPDVQKPVYQIPSSHQPGKAIISVDNLFANGYPQSQGHTEANPTASYYPSHISLPFQSANAYINAVNSGSQPTGEANANYNNSPTSTYIPGSSQNQADATANSVSQNTINYPGFKISEPQQTTQVIAAVDNVKPIGEFSPLIATQKPTSMYPQYYPNVTRNYGNLQSNQYYPANSQYDLMAKDLGISNPTESYELYNSNTLYNGKLYATEKPQHNAHNGISENQGYLEANGQSQNSLMDPTLSQGYTSNNALTRNSLNNAGYYVPGSYSSSKALNSLNSVAQASAEAEKDYPSNFNIRRPTISSLSSGYPYGYKNYLNPQISIFPEIINRVIDGYKGSSLKYAGKYDTGQGGAKSLLNSQNIYNPLSSGYSQNLRTKNMYSNLYPKIINYNVNPLHQFGHFGSSNNPDSIETSK